MTTVLIVEDDDAIRSNITRLLKLEGFRHRLGRQRPRGSGAHAPGLPDVVISDVSMPEMDGFAMLEAIRATGCWRPFRSCC
jgi:CheY-like chemotaxis protein